MTVRMSSRRIPLYAPRYNSPIVRRQRGLGALGAGNALSSAIGAGAGAVKTRNPVTGYAAQGAAIGATFGPIGAAIGAVIGAIGGAFIGAKRPESGLWDEYKKMSGTAAGHDYDNQFRNGAFVGLMRLGKNTFPPRAKGGYGTGDDDKFLQDMITKIAQDFRSGALAPSDAESAARIFDKSIKPWMAQWGEEPNADWRKWENQIVTDMIDAWLYDQPILATSYTTSTWAQPRVQELGAEIMAKYAPPPAPTQTSEGVPAKVPAPVTVPVPTVTTGIEKIPQPVPGATPAPVSATDPAMASYIQALISQGASQQEAFNAAMQALGRAGTPATPQAQQAVAEQVQQAGASSGLPSWAGYVLAGAAVLFALARPAKGKRR